MSRQTRIAADPIGAARRRHAVLALACFAAVTASVHAQDLTRSNRVVLRVNDHIATLYDYQRQVAEELRMARTQPGLTPEERQSRAEAAGRTVMRAIFDELLILSRGKQLGVIIEEAEVDQAVLNTQQRLGIETREELMTALAQSGMTEFDLRSQMRKQIIASEVRGREVMSRVNPTDERLREIYRDQEADFTTPEQREIRDVVVLETVEESERERIAAEVVQRVRDGEEPADVADAYGESVTQVDLGWVANGDLAAELEDVAWRLEEGAVSEPVAARGGLHVLNVKGVREQAVRPFEEVRDFIRRQEMARLVEIEMATYLRELEEKAYFTGDIPPEAAGFRTASGRSIERGNDALFFAASPKEASELGDVP